MAEGISGPSSDDEKKWRAESDARTLREAQEIRGDKKRLKMALACLEDIKADAEKALTLEQKVGERLKSLGSGNPGNKENY